MVSILFVALGGYAAVCKCIEEVGVWYTWSGADTPWKLPVISGLCFSPSMAIFLPFSQLRYEGYCVGGSPNTESVTGWE